MHAANGRPNEQCYPLELTKVNLWPEGEGVCGGIKWHAGIGSEQRQQRNELGLKRRFEITSANVTVPGEDAVIASPRRASGSG